MAILTALFATVLMAGLGMSLVLLGSAEAMLAGRDRDARVAAHAARGAAAIAVAELRAMPSWAGVIAPGTPADVCATPSSFVDDTLTPVPPWGGGALDLHAVTARVQAGSDAAVPAGRPVPVWRLFAYGPISRLIRSDVPRPPHYLAVWTADGGGGVLLVRAAALGPAGGFSAVQLSLAREAAGAPPRLLVFRPAP